MFRMVKTFKAVKVGEVFQFVVKDKGEKLFRKIHSSKYANAFYLDSRENCVFYDQEIVRTKQ